MNLVICSEYGERLAAVIERANQSVQLARHNLAGFAGQDRFVDEKIPLEKAAFRAWALTRFGKVGVASAIGLDRAAGRVPKSAPSPYPLLERVANLRRRLRISIQKAAPCEAGNAPRRILRFDNSRLAAALAQDTSTIVLAALDDDALAQFTDTITFTRSLWGRKIIWLAAPEMRPVQRACWREALSGFVDVTELSGKGEVDADARLIKASS